VARLEESGHAHVSDLDLPLLHGVDHVRAGVHDLEAHVHAVRLEDAFLGADEHRQVTEVVADHHIQHGQRLRGGEAGRYDGANQCRSCTQAGHAI